MAVRQLLHSSCVIAFVAIDRHTRKCCQHSCSSGHVSAQYAGVVGSDRWSGYTWLAAGQRQVGHPLGAAHLVGDFTALVERGGGSTALGTTCLDVADRLFALWYRVRDGTLDRAMFICAACTRRWNERTGTPFNDLGRAHRHRVPGRPVAAALPAEPAPPGRDVPGARLRLQPRDGTQLGGPGGAAPDLAAAGQAEGQGRPEMARGRDVH